MMNCLCFIHELEMDETLTYSFIIVSYASHTMKIYDYRNNTSENSNLEL